MIENYFSKIASLGVVMDLLSVEELPFFEKKHEAPTEEEPRERSKPYRACRENLRTDTEPGDKERYTRPMHSIRILSRDPSHPKESRKALTDGQG